MQERYLGDSHDFLKYALLRHLQRELDLVLGVNWYLTSPEHVDRAGNNDGEKRHHLKGGDWPATDPDLFDLVGRFDDPSTRSIDNVADWEILPPATVYHADLLRHDERDAWHATGLERLKQADLVFLDPDNGFEVPSMTRRTTPKYALYREATDYIRRGQAVLGIQFARQCDPVQRALQVRHRLIDLVGAEADLPVIRGRVAPNILFFSMATEQMHERLSSALRTFVSRCQTAEVKD